MDEKLGARKREKTTCGMRLKYTKDALQDLTILREFIAVKNPDAAQRISSELVSGIEHLTAFPKMGLEVKEAPNPDILRDIFILDYHVRYLALDETLYILRIWHQKEDR